MRCSRRRCSDPGNPLRQVRRSTATALCQLSGWGCAERVAQEFGGHPELAATRMRWARQAVAGAFGEQASRQPGPRRTGQQPPDPAA